MCSRVMTEHGLRLLENEMNKQTRVSSAFSIVLMLFIPSTTPAAEVDWAKVDTATVKVFYPGVASWEFLRTKDHGRGASVVRKNEKSCADCHVGKDGGYDIKADQIISGELKTAESKLPFEPQPIAGATGFKDLKLQAAYDGENIHLRIQWQGSGASVVNPAIATDGKADRIALQISNNIGSFKNYGCYITCHGDQDGMPDNSGTEVTLYGYYTRDKNGSIKDQTTLDDYLSKGQFIDLLEASFAGNEVKTADMHILDKRLEDNNDLTASGGFENGTYTVVISRKLSTGDKNDIVLSEGGTFNLGIAVHDNQNEGRKHYTSFPVSIGLSSSAADADINAQKF